MRLDGRFLKDFWVQETPSGLINGLNTSFTFSQTPKEAACVMVFLGGLLLNSALDYSITGTTLTFTIAPPNLSILRVIYVRKTGE